MNQELMKNVADLQKDFVYDFYESGDYKIYHCHKPGTNVYSFEITLGKMGIYVGGDIGSLVYRVARGIEFLAGNDVDYYQHSKLEHIFYNQEEFSQENLNDFLFNTLLESIQDHEKFREAEQNEEYLKIIQSGVKLDEDEAAEYSTLRVPTNLSEVVKFYQDNGLDAYPDRKPEEYNYAWDLYEELKGNTDLAEVRRAIYDSRFNNGDIPCLSKTDEGVMFRLYMVNHAAKQIIAQRKMVTSEDPSQNVSPQCLPATP
jgi:hypothetical protein